MPSFIAGVTTSVTAFVGATGTGRANAPVRCSSFADYQKTFGGLVGTSEVSYAVLQFFANGGTDAIVVSVSNEAQSTAERTVSAIRALERDDSFDLLCVPGVSDPAVLQAAADFCTTHQAFFIADAPATETMPDDVVALAAKGAFPQSGHAAIYYPWIHVAPPNGGKLRRAAPSGTIAGLYARVDKAAGVWNSPAGTPFPLIGVSGLTQTLSDPQKDALNTRGINCIRSVRGSSPVVWGARTLAGGDSEWRYIAVRRLGLYIERSIGRGLTWAAFEPNAAPLWTEIRRQAESFMFFVWRAQHAMPATTSEEAYFVKCGMDTMTQSDVNAGIVNLIVGFAPVKPAEFIIIKIQVRAAPTQP